MEWYTSILHSFTLHHFSPRVANRLSKMLDILVAREAAMRKENPPPAEHIQRIRRAEICLVVACRSIWGHTPTTEDFKEVQ